MKQQVTISTQDAFETPFSLIPNQYPEVIFTHFDLELGQAIVDDLIRHPHFNPDTDCVYIGNTNYVIFSQLSNDNPKFSKTVISDTDFMNSVFSSLSNADIDPVEYRMRLITTPSQIKGHEEETDCIYYLQLLTVNP